jgi:hypothetical protein
MTGKTAAYGTAIVGVHAIAVALHALAHVKLQIPASLFQNSFIALVIVLAPIAAAILLWTRFRFIGALLLLLSMAGSFAFGAYNHFMAPGTDNVAEASGSAWGMLFRITAALLSAVEGLGCWIGAWAARMILRSSDR